MARAYGAAGAVAAWRRRRRIRRRLRVMTVDSRAGEPWQLPDAAAEAARAEHVHAAARAQVVGAARARQTAQARDVAPSAEVEREGAYAGLATRTIAYCVDIA